MPDIEYQYPGLGPFVDKAADGIGLKDAEQRSKAREGWHAARVNDALTQLTIQAREQAAGRYPKGTVKAVLDYVKLTRDGLKAQVDAIDAAIADAEKQVGRLASDVQSKAEADRRPLRADASIVDLPVDRHAESVAKAGKVPTIDSPPAPAIPGDEPQPSPTAVADEGKLYEPKADAVEVRKLDEHADPKPPKKSK